MQIKNTLLLVLLPRLLDCIYLVPSLQGLPNIVERYCSHHFACLSSLESQLVLRPTINTVDWQAPNLCCHGNNPFIEPHPLLNFEGCVYNSFTRDPARTACWWVCACQLQSSLHAVNPVWPVFACEFETEAWMLFLVLQAYQRVCVNDPCFHETLLCCMCCKKIIWYIYIFDIVPCNANEVLKANHFAWTILQDTASFNWDLASYLLQNGLGRKSISSRTSNGPPSTQSWWMEEDSAENVHQLVQRSHEG